MKKEFKTILIVDDTEFIRETLKEDLEEKYNCVCLTAEDVLKASELIKDFEIDAAIIDVHMPNGSGLILANLLNIPYILYTGSATSELISRFGDKIIPKPTPIKYIYERLQGEKK